MLYVSSLSVSYTHQVTPGWPRSFPSAQQRLHNPPGGCGSGGGAPHPRSLLPLLQAHTGSAAEKVTSSATSATSAAVTSRNRWSVSRSAAPVLLSVTPIVRTAATTPPYSRDDGNDGEPHGQGPPSPPS